MADAGIKIVSHQSLTLDLTPSCLEFSPLHPSYFLVGTYDLQKGDGGGTEPSSRPQKRNGSIVVYELLERSIVHVHTESRPSAILDLRFQTCPGKEDIVAVVSSTGTLEIFRFSCLPPESPKLTLLGTVRLPGIGEDVLFLQFAWHPSIPDTVAISTSQGGVHILQVGPDYKTSVAMADPLILHSLEAWCVTMSPTLSTPASSRSQTFTLFSGGDDSILQYATCVLRNELPHSSESLAVELPYPAVSVRGHDAGVTAILPLPCGSNIVVTGSYDDHIRVYSIQPLHETFGVRKARLLGESNLGGGVWRLRLVSHASGDHSDAAGTWRATILASCMHAGARIVRVTGSDINHDGVEFDILGRFEEHKSMNYASDFQPSREGHGNGELVCVSSSFYDKLLCLWTVQVG
jgi:diphthamide biosynthesis protein 7